MGEEGPTKVVRRRNLVAAGFVLIGGMAHYIWDQTDQVLDHESNHWRKVTQFGDRTWPWSAYAHYVGDECRESWPVGFAVASWIRPIRERLNEAAKMEAELETPEEGKNAALRAEAIEPERESAPRRSER